MYHIREATILNTTAHPELGLGPQRAAVARLRHLLALHEAQLNGQGSGRGSGRGATAARDQRRPSVRLVSLREVLPVARRECLAKVARQRRVAKHFG